MTAETRFLKGNHAIVTGGGHGLGRSIAIALARAGANVTVMGRHSEPLESCVAELATHGIESRAMVCDVSAPDVVVTAFAAASDSLGDPAILVNNAGYARATSFSDTPLATWRQTMEVNLTGPFLCTQQVVPAMVAAKRGRIINIASTAALRGYPTLAAYCASKHGLLGLTRSLAAELAQNGVTVNAVCPGYTEGGMSDQAVEAVMALRKVSAEEALRILLRNSPRKQLTTQEEVTATVLWLCSPNATAITGQALAVAGGEVM